MVDHGRRRCRWEIGRVQWVLQKLDIRENWHKLYYLSALRSDHNTLNRRIKCNEI